MGYLINCEYFNNLNENEDMAVMGIMAGICTSPYPSHTQLKKSGFPIPNWEFPVKMGTDSDNTHGDEFICHIYIYAQYKHVTVPCLNTLYQLTYQFIHLLLFFHRSSCERNC